MENFATIVNSLFRHELLLESFPLWMFTGVLASPLVVNNKELNYFQWNVSIRYKDISHSIHDQLSTQKDYNLFYATDFFLQPLKTSEDQRFSIIFREYRKRQALHEKCPYQELFWSAQYLYVFSPNAGKYRPE